MLVPVFCVSICLLCACLVRVCLAVCINRNILFNAHLLMNALFKDVAKLTTLSGYSDKSPRTGSRIVTKSSPVSLARFVLIGTLSKAFRVSKLIASFSFERFISYVLRRQFYGKSSEQNNAVTPLCL